MSKKPDDPKPGKTELNDAMPQHKRMAMGKPIPQGGGKGVTTK